MQRRLVKNIFEADSLEPKKTNIIAGLGCRVKLKKNTWTLKFGGMVQNSLAIFAFFAIVLNLCGYAKVFSGLIALNCNRMLAWRDEFLLFHSSVQ